MDAQERHKSVAVNDGGMIVGDQHPNALIGLGGGLAGPELAGLER